MIRVEVAGEVATLWIDNPGKRNAMTAEMWRAVPVVLSGLSGVRAVVLRGAGTTFCAGADIGALADIGAATAGENLAVAAEEALAAFPAPVIAAIEGDCIGGGCQLALACDLRIAAAGSRFGITPARLGVIYPQTSIRRLTRVAGTAPAQWLLLTGELVSAAQARSFGLVHEVVEDVHARVASLAATLVSRSLLSQVAMKEMLAGPVSDERAEGWMRLVRDSGEAAEGAAAFLARRKPSFPWRP
ncbi:enoyl-CoA hydratase/isomerase family protein [Catelliglobosispora koreensis]|uniref:enoyl-CoA hydratase/isomerase family protein n=1 Tax=Catelliglobosispora koreensis TaxID=129052 RepID=UPI0003756DC8|nr:enoyl-CoA hydratase/isomerase family protein [Catelliglobosispora koreensis]